MKNTNLNQLKEYIDDRYTQEEKQDLEDQYKDWNEAAENGYKDFLATASKNNTYYEEDLEKFKQTARIFRLQNQLMKEYPELKYWIMDYAGEMGEFGLEEEEYNMSKKELLNAILSYKKWVEEDNLTESVKSKNT